MLRHLRSFPLSLSLVILLLLNVPALAQYGASIQGTITDPSGAVVQGAKVIATDVATGKATTATTSSEGFYRITGLSPGKYKVTVESPSFKTQITEGVTVNAEAVTGRDVQLTAGSASENVTVTATADKIQTENANIGGSLTDTQIRELPSFGRDPYELLKLAPGIFGDNSRSGSGNVSNLPNNAGPGGSNSSIFQVENQVPISANGQRVSANNYQVDGVSVNSLQWGGAAIITPNEESVQEVKVSSSSYSAEDGRNSGAQINVVSKTGTNVWHGSALFRYGDPGLNAFNKYGSNFGSGKPDRVNRKLRDYGGSLGGPILKDKLFFFFSYEANRNHDLQTSARYVETPEFIQLLQAGRAGGIGTTILSDPLATPRILSINTPSCGDINGGVLCAAVPLAGGGTGLDVGSLTGTLGNPACFFCSGGGPLDGIADLQLAEIGTPFSSFAQQFNTRVDLALGKNTFAVSTYFSHRDDTNGDAGADARPMADIVFTPTNYGITLLWSRVISNTAVNEVRFNASRWHFNTVESSSSTNWGIPRIEIQDLLINNFDRVRYGADRGETTPAIFAQNSYEIRDTFSKVIGQHALKFGVEHRWEQDNNNLLGGARPLYTFQGLWNLANDAPIFELINADPTTGGPAPAQRYFRSRNFALFGQDDWKVRPNLTVNIGLRWEYFAPLSEAHGQASNLILDPDLENSRFVITDRLSNPDRNNFAPRFGFAWQPHVFEDRVSVRGGFGVAFNRIPDVLFANSRGNPPNFARFGLCCYAGSGILYALGANNSPTSYPANPVLGVGVDPVTNIPNGSNVEAWGALADTPTPYTYLYSLDTETQLAWKWIATIGYQGSVSHKLIRILNRNFVETANPRIFQAFFPTPDVNASFNALNVEVRRPFANNFSMAVKYRWSKSMDELSNEGPGGQTNQMWPQNLILDSGPSDYDATHSLTVYGLWQAPWFKGRTDTVGMLLGGWKFSGIYNFHTGFPWSPKYFTCEFLFGSCLSPIRPQAYLGGAGSDASNDAFMTGSNFPGGGGAFFTTDPGGGAPGIGRNSFRGPRYTDVDLTFGKDTSLPWFGDQRSNLELRIDLFNAFNKLNLNPLGFFSGGTIVTDPHLGQSDAALAGRVIELQTKFRF